MTSPDDESNEEHESTWRGLDEAEFRSSTRKLLTELWENEVENRPRMVRQLARARQIMLEEIASVFERDVNMFIKFHDTSTPQACRTVADRLNGDLSELGMALSDPSDAFPAKLGVASTPPSADQSWLQLEPIDPSARRGPRRLGSGNELRVLPAPPLFQTKGSGRSH